MSEEGVVAVTRGRIVAVASGYGVQGLGYAVVVTALPTFAAGNGLDEGMIALILLGVCVTAAGGSVLADLVAVRRNSRAAVALGFAVQAAMLVGVALAPPLPLFVTFVLVYGAGLGLIDAGANMQGVLAQRERGAPLLGRFHATNTVGAIAGALAMSGALAVTDGAGAALVLAAVMQLLYVGVLVRRLDPRRAAHRSRDAPAQRVPLPIAPVVMVGLVVFAAFAVDSAVSSWSTQHLVSLGAVAALAPVGYAVYQGGVLAIRLVTDLLTVAIGTRVLLIAALVAAAAGGLVTALVGGPVAAIVGFGLSGLAVGALIPLAFGLAARIAPERSDEVVARVNLYNYAGAVVGAVGVGVLIELVGATVAFLLPVVLLVAALPAVRLARRR